MVRKNGYKKKGFNSIFQKLYNKIILSEKNKNKDKKILLEKSIDNISLFLEEGKYTFKNNKIRKVKLKGMIYVKNNNFGYKNYSKAIVHFGGGWSRKVICIFEDKVLSCYPEDKIVWLKKFLIFWMNAIILKFFTMILT